MQELHDTILPIQSIEFFLLAYFFLSLGKGSIVAMKWTVKIRPELASDPRLNILARKCGGNRYEAVGRLHEFWSEAQSHWVNGNPIPEIIFDAMEGHLFLESNFAERVEGGYRAKGDNEHFSWLKEQRERGKKSVDARIAKYGTAKPIKREPEVNRGSTQPEPDMNRGSAEPEPEVNQELRTKNLELRTKNLEPKKRKKNVATLWPRAKSLGSQVWDIYSSKYEKAYGVAPFRNSKTNGICKTISQSVPIDQYEAIIAAFLADRNPRMVSRCHPIGDLLFDLNKYANIAVGAKYTPDLPDAAFWNSKDDYELKITNIIGDREEVKRIKIEKRRELHKKGEWKAYDIT